MKVIKYNNEQSNNLPNRGSNNLYSTDVTKLISDLAAIDILKKETLKNYFIGDEYGDSPLSQAIEEGDIKQIKAIYPIKEELSDAELLMSIAHDINDKAIREDYGITDIVAKKIYCDINDWLHLHGEDSSDLADNCTLFGVSHDE